MTEKITSEMASDFICYWIITVAINSNDHQPLVNSLKTGTESLLVCLYTCVWQSPCPTDDFYVAADEEMSGHWIVIV